MRIPKEEYLHSIRTGLEGIEMLIRNRYNRGDSSITFIAELYLQELLDVIFGTDLENLNFKHKNYPSIDLADTKKGIGWQITITSEKQKVKEKIKHTLEAFFNNNKNLSYEELNRVKEIHIFIATGKPSNLKAKDIPSEIDYRSGKKKINKGLFNINCIWDFSMLIDKILSIKDTEKLYKLDNIVNGITSRPSRPHYEFKEPLFISRNIYNEDARNQTITTKFFSPKNRNIALLANAGEGKSTYIDYLANLFSGDEDTFCIKIKLIRYSSTLNELINADCLNWKNYYKKLNFILILDGLDEVESSKFNSAINEIENFALQNKEVFIITTCRTNFYPLDLKNKQRSNFSISPYFIEPIKEEDIIEYIRKNVGTKTESLLCELKQSNFSTLIETPFFLKEIVEIYKTQGVLPKTRVQLFRELVEKKFEFEKTKEVSVKLEVERNEVQIKRDLNRVAFLMQYSHQSKISETELQELFLKSYNVSLIKRLFLDPISTDCKDYRFKHLNFQEYFAAQTLKNLEWKTLKKILFIKEQKKLRPKWLNTIAFLLSIADPESKSIKKILDRLIQDDKPSLVKIESENIPQKRKSEITISILEEHRNSNTYIWGEGFTSEDLGRFADIDNNEELVNYILYYLNQNEVSEEATLDAVMLLNQLKEPGIFKQAIIDIYIKLYRQNYKSSLGNIILNGFEKWKLYDADILEELIHEDYNLKKIRNQDILFSYIRTSGYNRISPEYLVRAVSAVINHKHLTGIYSMPKMINLISEANILNDFIKLLLNHPETKNISQMQRMGFWEELFRIVSKKVQIFTPNNDLQNNYFLFIDYIGDKLERYQDDASVLMKAKEILQTFDNENGIFKTHLIKTDKDKYLHNHKFYVPAILYEEHKNAIILSLLNDNLINKDRIILLKRTLDKINKENSTHLERFIVSCFGEEFTNIYRDPWTEHENNKQKLSLEAYLTKSHFISIIQTGLNVFSNPIKYDDITSDRFFRSTLPSAEIGITIDFLRELIDNDETLSKEEIINWPNDDKNWEYYLIDKYSCIIKTQNLPSENLKWIKDWCIKNEAKVDFETSISLGKEGSYSVNQLFYLFVSLSYYSLTPPDYNNCIKLIRYMGFLKVIRPKSEKTVSIKKWIKNIIGEEAFNDELIRLIKINNYEDSSQFILSEILTMIEKQELRDTKEELIKFIISDKIDANQKNSAFNLYIKFKGEYKIELRHYLTSKIDWKDIEWHIFDFISKYDPEFATTWFSDNINVLNIDPNRAAIQLLKLNPETAMELYLSELNAKKRALTDKFHENGNFLGSIDVKSFQPDYLLSSLLKTLNISLAKDFKSAKYSSVISDVFKVLFWLFQESQDENIIKKTKTKYGEISKNKDSYNAEEIKNLHYSYRDFQHKCKIEIDKSISFEKAIKQVKKISPELFS